MTPDQLKSSLLCSCLHGKTIDCYSKTCAKDEIDETFIINDVDDEPYAIPENWVWVRLGDIISFIGGSQPPKTKFIYEEKEGYTRLIQIRDFKTDAYKVYIPTDSTKKFFTSTDIMIGRYGPPIFQILRGLEGAYNVALMKAEPHINIDKDYLYYLLQDPVLFNVLVQKSNRCCGQDGIDMPTLKEYIVGLPPLEDQRSIVDKIEELLPYVDRYAKAYEKLEQFNVKFPKDMKKSILQYAIQGKLVEQRPEEGTAEELYQQIQDELKQLEKSKVFKVKDDSPIEEEEIPFDIPSSWKWLRLGQILNIESGKGLTAKQMKKGDIPVYGGNGITGYHDEALIHKETVVIGRVGFYCGSVHVTPSEAWVTDNAFITTYPEKSIYRDYLVYVLRFLNLGQNSNATAQPVVSGKKIYPMLFPLPPLEEQKRIAARIEEILPICERLVK